jgi:hypothetical protein
MRECKTLLQNHQFRRNEKTFSMINIPPQNKCRQTARNLKEVSKSQILTLQLLPSCVHYTVSILCTWVSRFCVMGFITSKLHDRFYANFLFILAFLMESRDSFELFILRLNAAQNNP